MQKSINVLVVESIGFAPYANTFGCQLTATILAEAYLKCIIKISCPVTGNNFTNIMINCSSIAGVPEEATRRCIQDFMNFNASVEYRILNCESQCSIHNGIDAVDLSSMRGEYRQMFENLFDKSKWQIPQNELFNV